MPAALALLATVPLPAGCRARKPAPPGPRLVVVYAPCTVSRLYLGPYDRRIPFTPALTAFAQEATRFERHQTETGQSGPSFASLLSGTQADRHGLFTHPAPLSERAYLLAEAFAERGYETHFWSGHEMASPDLGFAQGIQAGHVHRRERSDADAARLSANDAEFAAILERLKRDRSLRCFVQVLFTVTHAPYTDVPPELLPAFRRAFPGEWPEISDSDFERARRRYRRQRPRLEHDFPALVRERGWNERDVRDLAVTLETHYKARVWRLDTLFGSLIEAIRSAGLLEESLIAFTTDHGETLYREHLPLHWSHGLQLSPDVIQIPLLVRLPDGGGPRVYPGVSRSIDVHPTLLALAGLRLAPSDGRVDGRDLSAALLGRAPVPRLRAFSHTIKLNDALAEWFAGRLVGRLFPSTDVGLIWTAVRDGDTFVRRRRTLSGEWRTEAFDLASDPVARSDVFDPSRELHRTLAAELDAYKARLVLQHERLHPDAGRLEASARERLRSLGYIE